MVNETIKKAIKEAKEKGIKQWQIAESYGLCEGNFSRLMRHELPEEEKNKILEIIEEIKRGVAAGAK